MQPKVEEAVLATESRVLRFGPPGRLLKANPAANTQSDAGAAITTGANNICADIHPDAGAANTADAGNAGTTDGDSSHLFWRQLQWIFEWQLNHHC
jgi:hypothetical protein